MRLRARGQDVGVRVDKREPTDVETTEANAAVVRVQPATPGIAKRIVQVLTAIGALDGLMYRDNAPQAHVFDFLVGELKTNETGDFEIRGDVLPLGGFRKDVLHDAKVARVDWGPHDNDFGGDTVRRLEVGRQEDLPRVVTDIVITFFQTLKQISTGGTVGNDLKTDVTIRVQPPFLLISSHNLPLSGLTYSHGCGSGILGLLRSLFV